jgi:hypothetical protein
VTCQWYSPGTPVSSINKPDHHDITERLLKSGGKHHKPTKLFYARTGSKNTNVLHLTHHWCYKNLVCRNTSPNVHVVRMSPEIKNTF